MEFSLPFLCPPPAAGLPSGQIKSRPEDFIVEELPLYEPRGEGTHTYFWIEKRQLNTLDAVQLLARSLGKRAADAGVAGLKDAQAVARQWCSFEHVAPEALEKFRDFSNPGLRVLKTIRHTNKLKMGHLSGNRFCVLLRSTEAGTAGALAARAAEVFEILGRRGLPNYYGPQRFGRGGHNAALGRALVRGDKAEFERLLAASGTAAARAGRKLRNLFVNAFQAELFNQVLARRMPEIGRLEAGDLCWLHRNGAVFSVPNGLEAAREQPRADAFEISPSGPLFGPKMPAALGRPGEIETAVLKAEGVALDAFGRREAESQPGARRPLRVPLLEKPSCEVVHEGLSLRFVLPPGSYASVLLREITQGAEIFTDRA